MSFSEILDELPKLTAAERREIGGRATALNTLAESKPAAGQRIAGLHEGMASTSDDFDAPLPDEFWLGANS